MSTVPDLTGHECEPGFTELPEVEQRAICSECAVRIPCALFGITDPSVTAANPDYRRGAAIVYGGFNLAELHRMAAARGLVTA
ncbi:MAG: hypothetical protein ACRDQA_23770 [Nocardioidaceae bacterium]